MPFFFIFFIFLASCSFPYQSQDTPVQFGTAVSPSQ